MTWCEDLGLVDDWWPDALAWHLDEPPVIDGRVKLALVENHDEALKHRHVYAALGDPGEARRLITSPGFKGHDPDSNGPHPSAGVGEYEPRFWVFTDGSVEFEPLAIRWDSGGMEVVLPDQGLLMTYGLVPRYTQDQVVHWDDLETPQPDRIIADTSTSNLFAEPGTAFVDADAALVQDYSSLRGLSVVQVYYLETPFPADDKANELLGEVDQIEIELSGRTIVLVRMRNGEILARCWGVRLVIDPGAMPFTEGRWEYGEFDWPGAGIISKEAARMAGIGDHASEVFVRDTVLARFEGQPDIAINPESGAVSYKNQWSVSWCQRHGRDLIRVDLKKLYEGNRPEIVRHYHDHAVEPPPLNDRRWGDPNVATRAKRLALAWTYLGEAMERLATTFGIGPSAEDFVGVARAELEYRGWWSDGEFELIARHIPPGLSRDGFIDRCGAIHRATVDRLGEGVLRQLVHAMGFDPGSVSPLRSLKLLERVVAFAIAATSAGLDVVEQRTEILERAQPAPMAELSTLFKVNEIRQLSGHATRDRQERLEVILRELGIDPRSAAGGYDYVLDEIYDRVAASIEEVAATLMLVRRRR